MMFLFDAGLVLAAYLLGSISTAILVCKLMGLPDPRSLGSGNPGATNVLRIGGRKAAAFTLVGDFAKGLIPVVVAQLADVAPITLASVGMAAFLGHLYPVFFGFQGGKGVATGAGVLLGFSWQLGLLVVATWLIAAKISRISSAAALTATALTPVYGWFLPLPKAIKLALLPLCAMVLWRHRENIRRLLSGAES